VLISSGVDLITEVAENRRRDRPWTMWALPEDLADTLSPAVLAAAADIGYIQMLLEERGVRRDVARRWPQPLGFRIVCRLAERGRIAFALVVAPRDLMRAGRLRAGKDKPRAQRIEADALLRAFGAAGRRTAEIAPMTTPCLETTPCGSEQLRQPA
jgi:hypothetical protein